MILKVGRLVAGKEDRKEGWGEEGREDGRKGVERKGWEEGGSGPCAFKKVQVLNGEFSNSLIYNDVWSRKHAWCCPRTGATSVSKQTSSSQETFIPRGEL